MDEFGYNIDDELTKELADRLMKMKGETRGFNLEHDIIWILKERGKEGLIKVEEETRKVGYPIEYEKLKKMGFYPAGLRAISLLAIKKAFNMDAEGIKNVCALHPKVSLVVRLFAKYFYSIPKTMEKASAMWKAYWTEGELVSVSFDLKEKRGILRLQGFDLHPLFCCCEEGYFKTVGEMVTGSKEVTCKETKCTFRGDKYHEYEITYK